MPARNSRQKSPAQFENKNLSSPRRHQSTSHHKSHKELQANYNVDPNR